MTDTQLYLAIFAPVVANGALVLLAFWGIHHRISDLVTRVAALEVRFAGVETRLAGLEIAWRTELLRVEGVLDARLKHLEESNRP